MCIKPNLRASHWGWPHQAPETGAVLSQDVFHKASATQICGFTRTWITADVSLESSCGRLKTPSYDRALNVFLTVIQSEFVWAPGPAGNGWGWEAAFSVFWWQSRFGKFVKWSPLKVVEIQSFLIRFFKSSSKREEECGGKQGETMRPSGDFKRY